MRTSVLALLAVLSLAPSAVAAQTPPLRTDSTRVARPTAVSVSPLSILLGAFAADVERAISRTNSLGLGVTYENRNSLFFRGQQRGDYDLDASVKLRYYPAGTALDGFAVAFLAGGTVYKRHNAVVEDDDPFADDDGNVALTVGFSADYNKLAGADRRLLLGTGIGMKRRFVRDRNLADAVTAIRPTVRAVIGYAF